MLAENKFDLGGLLDVVAPPCVISIHGESGTGKSLVAAHFLTACLDVGRSATALFLGRPGEVGQFLNQTMGIGLDLYRHLRTNALRLWEEPQSSFAQVSSALQCMNPCDFMLMDHVEQLSTGPASDLERALASAFGARFQYILFTATGEVGLNRPYAKIQVDLSRSGREVEKANADAVAHVRVNSTIATKVVRVGATELELWEP